MTILPDHVVRDVSFDELNVEDAVRRLDHLEKAIPAVYVNEAETDRKTSIFLRSGNMQINVFAQKPELNVIVIQTNPRSNTRFSLSMPFDEHAFEAVGSNAMDGMRSLIATWRHILEADAAKVARDSGVRDLMRFDHRDEVLETAIQRAMKRAACVVAIHNPTRGKTTQVVLCPPCMDRPGTIVDRNRKPILAKPLEAAILMDVPNVAVVSRPDPGRFQISRHEMTSYQQDLVDGDVVQMMRTIASLPQVPKPLLKAGMAAD